MIISLDIYIECIHQLLYESSKKINLSLIWDKGSISFLLEIDIFIHVYVFISNIYYIL